MKGSEKQIAWAEKILKRAAEELEDAKNYVVSKRKEELEREAKYPEKKDYEGSKEKYESRIKEHADRYKKNHERV